MHKKVNVYVSISSLGYRPHGSQQMSAVCLICKVQDQNENVDFITRCHHSFHQKCIENALKNTENVCPFCKKLISSDKYFEKMYLDILAGSVHFESLNLEDLRSAFNGIIYDGNRIDLLEQCYQLGVDVNFKLANQKAPIGMAAENGDLNIFKSLIEHGADIKVLTGEYGKSLLHIACENGHLDLVKYIIEHLKVETNSKDSSGSSPLHYACSNGDVDIVKYLLYHGADANIFNCHGHASIHVACNFLKLDIVKVLVEHGVDVNISQPPSEDSPIQIASQNHSIEIIKYLHKHGANLNTKGLSPLHYACIDQDIESVKYLLEQGADIHARTCSDTTSLHISCRQGDLEIVKLLSKNGADIHAKDDEERTPMHYACSSGNLELIKFLFDLGADLNVLEPEHPEYSKSFLNLADKKEVVQLLNQLSKQKQNIK